MSRKRRPLGGNMAIVAQAVADLKNEFQYPDVAGRGISNPSPQAGGGGGAPTVVVAASDALDIEKQKADFFCTGTNDQDVINSAAALFPTNQPGRILLVGKTFNISATINLELNITLEGMNRSVVIQTDDPTITMVTCGIGQNRVRTLTLSGGPVAGSTVGLLGIAAGSNMVIEDVSFFDMETAILAGEDMIVTDCVTQFVTLFVDAGANSDAGQILITGNGTNTAGGGVAAIRMRDGFGYWHIEDNFLGSWVHRTTNLAARAQNLSIIGNTWVNPFGAEQDLIDILDVDGLVIVGNNMHDLNGYDPGRIEGCHGAIIANNQADNMIAGWAFDSSDKMIVMGNQLGVGDDSYIGEHGFDLLDCSDCLIASNLINQPGQDTDNTYDGIHVRGDSDDNFIHGNNIIGASASPQPRYGINISAATCDCNKVVGNAGSEAALFGTAPINDSGTDTQLFWPADPTDGDNLFGCSGS